MAEFSAIPARLNGVPIPKLSDITITEQRTVNQKATTDGIVLTFGRPKYSAELTFYTLNDRLLFMRAIGSGQDNPDPQLRTPEQLQSELLFPAPDGKVWCQNTIGCLFRAINEEMARRGFSKRITPRAMRRSFHILVDKLQVTEALQRSISGHATAAMSDRYRSQQEDAQRAVVGQIFDLAGVATNEVGQMVGQRPQA